MVHLDLKPDNMLYSGTNLKLADLGLCRLARVKRWMELDEGDSRYLAREVLNYNSETDLTKADIFSLGLSLYEGMSLIELPNNGLFWHQLRGGFTLINQP
jgi:wee1-like protein kinase